MRGERVAFWTGLAVVLAVTAACAAAVRFAGPPVYDGDGYFHIRFAEILRHEGISRTFPWFQESFLKDHFVNFNLLYHLLLVPFTFGDLLTGARTASIVFAAATMGVLYVSAHRLRLPHPALLALAVLAFAPDALYRYTFTRPVVLSVTWLVAGTTAVLLARRVELAVLSALFAHLHCSYHVLPCIALAHDLLRDRDPSERGLARCRTTLASAGGALVGSLLTPYFPHNLRFWWIANVGVLSNSWTRGQEVRIGTEMLPLPADELLLRNLGLFAVLALALVGLLAGRRAGSQARTLLLIAGGFLALSALSQRFVELLAPFTLLLAGVVLRDRLATAEPRVAWRRAGVALAACTVALMLVVSVRENRASLVGDTSGELEPAARWIAANVPEGETIFNLGWDDFPELYFHAWKQRYVIGLDPTFIYRTDAARAQRWTDVARGRDPAPYETIRRMFRSRFVVVPARYVSFARQAETDPRFVRRFHDLGATVYELDELSGFVTAWSTAGWYADPARVLFDEPIAPEPGGADRPPDGRAVPAAATEGAHVDLTRLAGVPPGVEDVCAIAVAAIRFEREVEGAIAVTTDDEIRVWAGGALVAARSPYRSPPPGAPGGPPLPLDALDPLRKRIREERFPVRFAAGGTPLVVKTCGHDARLGFFLRVEPTPDAVASAPPER